MLYDKDIREPLFEFFEDRKDKIRILEEKQIGKSRADVMIIEDNRLCGIEIKSDADTYVRLEGQIADYDRYFDENYVVVGSTHATHVGEHLPPWWGIISVELIGEEINFYVVREAEKNPNMDVRKKIELLWRPELAHIVDQYDMPKYKTKSKAFVVEELCKRLTGEQLNHHISEELFERDYTTIFDSINKYREETGQKKRRRRKYKRKKKA